MVLVWPIFAKVLAGIVGAKVGQKSPIVGAAIGGLAGGGAGGGAATAGSAAPSSATATAASTGPQIASTAAPKSASFMPKSFFGDGGMGGGTPTAADFQAYKKAPVFNMDSIQKRSFRDPLVNRSSLKDVAAAALQDVGEVGKDALSGLADMHPLGRIINAGRGFDPNAPIGDRVESVFHQTLTEARNKPPLPPPALPPDTVTSGGFADVRDKQRAFNARIRRGG